MLEHPVITRLLSTGQPEIRPRRARTCRSCGAALTTDRGCCRVAGKSYCESCIKTYRKEVEL